LQIQPLMGFIILNKLEDLKMNALERIVSTVNFHESDRVPVIPQVFGHAAALSDVPLDEYIQDGNTIARCQLSALDYYGYDAIFTVVDVNIETEALGSVLDYRKNQYAVIKKYALSDDNYNIDHLAVPDCKKSGRMPEILKAINLLKKSLNNDILIVGCVLGPLTLTTQLLGIEKALYLAIDAPERFEKLLDFSCQVITDFGLAQISAGAHLPIVFNPSASPAVIPHQFFREFEFPRLKKMFHAFKANGSIANWLHIAGPSDSILPYYSEIGVNISNFDYCVHPQTAMTALPHTCLNGNIKSLAFIDDNANDIRSASKQLLNTFSKRGGFILSSGCEIPKESRSENIAAMVQAAKLYK